jgi:hypothetical protein
MKANYSALFLAYFFILNIFSFTQNASAQQKGEGFEGIDVTWQNGSDRRDSSTI